jgi:hypothetical protein
MENRTDREIDDGIRKPQIPYCLMTFPDGGVYSRSSSSGFNDPRLDFIPVQQKLHRVPILRWKNYRKFADTFQQLCERRDDQQRDDQLLTPALSLSLIYNHGNTFVASLAVPELDVTRHDSIEPGNVDKHALQNKMYEEEEELSFDLSKQIPALCYMWQQSDFIVTDSLRNREGMLESGFVNQVGFWEMRNQGQLESSRMATMLFNEDDEDFQNAGNLESVFNNVGNSSDEMTQHPFLPHERHAECGDKVDSEGVSEQLSSDDGNEEFLARAMGELEEYFTQLRWSC